MENTIKSIRPFIGAKNYSTSCKFYKEIGFTQVVLANNLSVFKLGNFAFYLQDAYVKDWVDNTMVFLEVTELTTFYNQLKALNLPETYEGVKLSSIQHFDWGSECYLHDPSGILWHIGLFTE